MPVGLTSQEDIFLLVAVGPAVIAAVVVWYVWRWAKRSEAEQLRYELYNTKTRADLDAQMRELETRRAQEKAQREKEAQDMVGGDARGFCVAGLI